MVMGDDSSLICCKNCIVCLKRPKINENEAGVGPFKKDFELCSMGFRAKQ